MDAAGECGLFVQLEKGFRHGLWCHVTALAQSRGETGNLFQGLSVASTCRSSWVINEHKDSAGASRD